jgi:glyoxylase-like metal-dependent hydrolase (beta-lactamase superfamily II)
MVTRLFTGFAAVALVVCASPLLAQRGGPPPPPLVRENATEKVSAHTYAILDQSVPMVPNVGIVVGDRAVLVIDTGMGARNGQTIMREVEKLTKTTEVYLVTTHIHPEHDLGAHGFPPATKMIRSNDQVKEIAAVGLTTAKVFASRSPIHAELMEGADFRKADITFDGEHRLDLGGVRVRILTMGANHTIGDTAVFVEPDAVLYSGDIVMTGLSGLSSPSSTIKQWLTSLERFTALKPLRIVPSHGPIAGTEIINNYQTLFRTAQQRAAELKKQGRSLDEAAQTIATELQERYPDRNRVMGIARAAYNEAQ